jgi:hypothetical protein
MMTRYFIVGLSLIISLTTIPVFAEQRLALVIGNATYSEARLANPINDATDMSSALKTLGFEVILKTDVNHRTMVEAVQDFGERLRRDGGVGLFYYAGHGLQYHGNNYLIPIGARLKSEADLEFETMDANRVLEQMENAHNNTNFVILDACRSNPYGRGFSRGFSRGGLAEMKGSADSLIVYATSPGKTAADGPGRNGTYTKHLVAALRDLAHESVLDLFTEVTKRVKEETKGEQIPWQSSSLTQKFCLGGCGRKVTTMPPPTTSLPSVSMAPPATTARAVAETRTAQITCESQNKQYNECHLSGQITNAFIVKRLSTSSCEQNSAWGYDSQMLWVNKGCRAIFEVTLGATDTEKPAETQDIPCESLDFKYNECHAKGKIKSAWVISLSSRSECKLSNSFGFANNVLWVNGGCQAVFRVVLLK